MNKILQGDVLTVLKTLPSESVHCIITSPPYFGLRDYGIKGQIGLENSMEEYLKQMLVITAELKRVLRKDGTMFWNHGDSYAGSGKGFGDKEPDPKFKSILRGGGTARSRTLRPEKSSIPAKSLMLQAHRLAIRMTDEQGWILRNQIIWHKPNIMPQSIKDRFTVDFEPVFFFTKSQNYWFEQQQEPIVESSLKDKRRGRIDYDGKWANTNGNQTIAKRKSFAYIESGGRNKRTVWKITTKPFKEAHFATFPETLIEIPVKAGCPEFICKKCGKAREKIIEIDYNVRAVRKSTSKHFETKNLARPNMPFMGDKIVTTKGYTDCGCNAGWTSRVILDPFMGSGTTAIVARRYGRQYLGIELNPEYIHIAEKRLGRVQLKLITNV